MVRRIALQFHAGVVLNGTVQHAGSHGNLGLGTAVHLVGLARRIMMQSVYMGIGRQGYIPARFNFFTGFHRGRPRGFQGYPRRH